MAYHRRLLSSVLASATAFAIGCAGMPPGPAENAQPIEVRTLPSAEAYRSFGGLATRARLVIRDAASWSNLWQQMTRTSQPRPPVPAVDFASDVVIVAAMGTKSSGGYAIRIDDVRVADGDAWIAVTEESPGSGCATTAVLTAPVAVAVVSRFAGEAVFLEHA